ncbi:GntR family transcriptional regulator [Candidatus Omnitrophota bacterium]
MKAEPKYYFQISTSSGVPIYRQVIDQVKTLIATGRLEKGEFLPSVRKVSKELEVNPMTVSKAYSLLEKEGVLEFVRGQGMKVGESSISQKNLEKREVAIIPLLKEVVVKAYQLSLEPKKVIELINDLWKE